MLSKLDVFFANQVTDFTARLSGLERRIAGSAIPQRDENLEDLTAAINESRDACRRIQMMFGDDLEWLQEVKQRFRREIGHWFNQSWFMQRALAKPRGYPGDYELLSAIYDGRPRSTGFGGYLDLYFLGTELGRAVPARLYSLQQFLLDEFSRRHNPITVLNVACGPLRELAWGLGSEIPVGSRLVCIDADRDALKFVENDIASRGAPPLEVVCEYYNALRMSNAAANVRKFGRADIIYSVGLCDYIPDKHLIAMLRGWRESVGNDGVVYVAFKDSREYDAVEYQWHVDWNFFQRTEQDCWQLFRQAGYDMEGMDMTRDTTGIIMNFAAHMNPATIHRVDRPEYAQATPSVARGRVESTPPAQK